MSSLAQTAAARPRNGWGRSALLLLAILLAGGALHVDAKTADAQTYVQTSEYYGWYYDDGYTFWAYLSYYNGDTLLYYEEPGFYYIEYYLWAYNYTYVEYESSYEYYSYPYYYWITSGYDSFYGSNFSFWAYDFIYNDYYYYYEDAYGSFWFYYDPDTGYYAYF